MATFPQKKVPLISHSGHQNAPSNQHRCQRNLLSLTKSGHNLPHNSVNATCLGRTSRLPAREKGCNKFIQAARFNRVPRSLLWPGNDLRAHMAVCVCVRTLVGWLLRVWFWRGCCHCWRGFDSRGAALLIRWDRFLVFGVRKFALKSFSVLEI